MSTRRTGHHLQLSQLLLYLAQHGPATRADACRALGLSQPTFSRLVAWARLENAGVLAIGHGRATRYAAARQLPTGGTSLRIFEVLEGGTSRELAVLHAVRPRGFYVESRVDECESALHDDLPWFLNELRPAGFLGRLIPRHRPELQLPNDITLWTAEQCLMYLTRHGWDMPGSLIVGDEAFRMALAHAREPTWNIRAGERAQQYPASALAVLTTGTPGSSAAGEQPKFLCHKDGIAVQVKFSPSLSEAPGDRAAQRIADLLVAEHLALTTLAGAGHDAAQSELVFADGRVFLETVRFDRLASAGRRGVISLFALDAEYVGHLSSWSDTAAELERIGRIDAAALREIRWRELFGQLIANTDMHSGNLSFFMRGTRACGLAPIYDMLPAMYSPVHGQMPDLRFTLPMPRPSDGDIWPSAWSSARRYWQTIAADNRISSAFRAIAAENAAELESGRDIMARLPTRAG